MLEYWRPMDQHEERTNPKFVLGGGKGLLDFVFLINKNVDYEKTRKGTSQSGDPFVLVLLKCFHNTFTRCPRFSVLFV